MSELPVTSRQNLFVNGFVALIAVLIFSIAFFSPISNTDSDARFSLLVSQSLLENQTIRLDAYSEQIEGEAPVEWRLLHLGDHLYYLHPLGSSMLALPVVLLFHSLGYDMSLPADEAVVQNLLSAIIVVSIFLIIFRVARYYLSPKASIVIATVSILGTTFISTLSTALWNLDFAVLFIWLSLWLLVRWQHQPPAAIEAIALGIFLFLAFLSRPTTAVFIACVLIFLFFRHRNQFWPTAVTAVLFLMLLSLLSFKELGTWLPPYYLPRQLGGLLNYGKQEATPMPIAIYGLLLSPSRGLFVFTPFFFLSLSGVIFYWRSIRQ